MFNFLKDILTVFINLFLVLFFKCLHTNDNISIPFLAVTLNLYSLHFIAFLLLT